MTIYEIHAKIVTDLFTPSLNDNDTFLLLVILHSHRIHLKEPVLADRPLVLELAAITQRHAAEAISRIWTNCDDPRRASSYLYFRWHGDWRGYEHAENLTEIEQHRHRELIKRLESHPLIEQVVEED